MSSVRLAAFAATTLVSLSAHAAGEIAISGASTFELTADYGLRFDSLFTLRNTTDSALTLTRQLFLFAAPGGYAYPGPGTELWGVWGSSLAAREQKSERGGWGYSAPVAHMVMRIDGRNASGKAVSGTGSVALSQAGRTPPEASPYTTADTAIGVHGPLEILPLSNGKRWLPVAATHVDMTNSATLAPTVSLQARDAKGKSLATLKTASGPAGKPIWPFQGWAELKSSAQVAHVLIKSSQKIGGKSISATRQVPVVAAAPIELGSPVAGRWSWDNGPGRNGWQGTHLAPEERYAYDLCIKRTVNGVTDFFSGDPRLNANWHCWDQPIRAARAGVVRFVDDANRDNDGNQQNVGGSANTVVIEHAGGLFTRYAHLRQGSAAVAVGQSVSAGQMVGRVGNSGGSSGPHLHFAAFRLDASGYVRAVPTAFSGLQSITGTALQGVPASPSEYVTP